MGIEEAVAAIAEIAGEDLEGMGMSGPSAFPWEDGLEPSDVHEWVYFVQAESGGPVKIGVSRKPAKRLAALQTASYDPLRILGILLSGRDGWSEAAMHERFKADRLHGEWFCVSEELNDFVVARFGWCAICLIREDANNPFSGCPTHGRSEDA